jgi:hypothetical protein
MIKGQTKMWKIKCLEKILSTAPSLLGKEDEAKDAVKKDTHTTVCRTSEIILFFH